MSGRFKIGQIVPSSNMTMETKIPAVLWLREALASERVSMDAEFDGCALEILDNLEAGRRDTVRLPRIVAGFDSRNVDAIVLSACVRGLFLAAMPLAEARTGRPVVTATIETAFEMPWAVDLTPALPGGCELLSGAYGGVQR